MAVTIKFDSNNYPIVPTLILAKKSGEKIGVIPAYEVTYKDNLTDGGEMTFRVNKYNDGTELAFWDDIIDFKLLWCRDWNQWFEITVTLNEDTETTKSVSAVSLGEAELSQINIYNTEINTEDDIARDDYVEPTVLYNPDTPEASLLHRILEKAPHYAIGHIDTRLWTIQRTFTFDNITIYDALNEIAEEIDCLVVLSASTDEESGGISREINIYDLESYCNDCGKRGEFQTECTYCGSTNISEGYGDDTTIFVSKENLAQDISYSADADSVKNCFKLYAGDDLMTAAVKGCNPNGSDYLWYFNDSTKADMSEELSTALTAYDEKVADVQATATLTEWTGLGKSAVENAVNAYNEVVAYIADYTEDFPAVSDDDIVGYSAIIKFYYDLIDLGLFLESGLMPSETISATGADEQKKILEAAIADIDSVAIQNYSKNTSTSTMSSAVKSYAAVLVDSRYKVSVDSDTTPTSETVKDSDGNAEYSTWKGKLVITAYSDDTDTATTDTLTVKINGDIETYTKQKIEQKLQSQTDDGSDIVTLFEYDTDIFAARLKAYSLERLTSFLDACQACLDIMAEQGVVTGNSWNYKSIYEDLYVPYYEKLKAIQNEIKVREGQVDTIAVIEEQFVELAITNINNALDIESYLGGTLYTELLTFRREDTYTNDNYISDGLTNAELIENALDFLNKAQTEIYKSAELQHSISSTLSNLLVMREFQPIVDMFSVGNWIRFKVDGTVYKLRLLEYEIDFDNPETLSVQFSDVRNMSSGVSDLQSLLGAVSSMSTSYSSVTRQAEQGSKSYAYVDNWTTNGLEATNTKIVSTADNQEIVWDSHGMLFRKWDDYVGDYDERQMKIINSTMAITKDNWETISTAVGRFYYTDPSDGTTLIEAYGINAETLVGKVILGESLGVYNSDMSLRLDKNGFSVYNGVTTFTLLPSTESNFLTISNDDDTQLMYVDTTGNLYIKGNITATSLTLGSEVDISTNNISGLSDYATSSDLSDYAASVTETLKSYVPTTTYTEDKGDGFVTINQLYGTTEAVSFEVSPEGLLTATNAIITGTVYATNGSFSGTVIASAGKIGAWNIGTLGTDYTNSLYSNALLGDGVYYSTMMRVSSGTNAASNVAIGVRSNTSSDGENINDSSWSSGSSTSSWVFRVTQSGSLKATDATIVGDITATSGTIGGWTIGKLDDGTRFLGSSGENSADVKLFATGSVGNVSDKGTGYYVNSSNDRDGWVILAGYAGDGLKHYFGVKSTGEVQATKGTIGAWNIGTLGTDYTNSLYSNAVSSDGVYYSTMMRVSGTASNVAIGVRSNTSSDGEDINDSSWSSGSSTSSWVFRVTQSGSLKATDATIVGDITATSGTIGGWSIRTLANGTKLFASDASSNNPNVMLLTEPSSGVITKGDGYYVLDENDRDGWFILADRKSDTGLQYGFGVREKGISGTFLGQTYKATWTQMQCDFIQTAGIYAMSFVAAQAMYTYTLTTRSLNVIADNDADNDYLGDASIDGALTVKGGASITDDLSVSGTIAVTGTGSINSWTFGKFKGDTSIRYLGSGTSNVPNILLCSTASQSTITSETGTAAGYYVNSLDDREGWDILVGYTGSGLQYRFGVRQYEDTNLSEVQCGVITADDYMICDRIQTNSISSDGYGTASLTNGGIAFSAARNEVFGDTYFQASSNTGSGGAVEIMTNYNYLQRYGGVYFKSGYEAGATGATNKAAVRCGYLTASSDTATLRVESTSRLIITSNYGIAPSDTSTGITLTSSQGTLYGTWAAASFESTTSDANYKNSIEEIPQAYSILFDNLSPVIFKYNYGTSDRYHTGFIAQSVESAIEASGLTTQDFGGFVKATETEVNEETGEETEIEKYYLRYEEFIALNTYEIQKLKKRVAELEALLAAE